MAAVLRAPNQLSYFVCFFALFVTSFVHNVAAVSYDRKELLDIRTEITHLELDKDFFFNETEVKDIMLLPDKAQIPITRMKKQRKYMGRRSGCLVRICRRVCNPPPESILLANHWRINWMSSIRDPPTNKKLKTEISYVSPSRG